MSEQERIMNVALLRRADENMYREKKRYYSQADAARKPES